MTLKTASTSRTRYKTLNKGHEKDIKIFNTAACRTGDACETMFKWNDRSVLGKKGEKKAFSKAIRGPCRMAASGQEKALAGHVRLRAVVTRLHETHRAAAANHAPTRPYAGPANRIHTLLTRNKTTITTTTTTTTTATRLSRD